MAVSKANQRAVNKYKKNNYDRIEITVPKGRREVFQTHAAAVGQSVNAYINAAIDEKMAQEAVESPTRTADGRAVSLPSEIGKHAPAASEGCLEGVAAEETEE